MRTVFSSLVCIVAVAFPSILSAQVSSTVQPLVGHTASVNAAVYTADHKHVITVGADQTVRIWDVATGKEIRTLAGHTSQVLSVASSPDSSTFVTGGADNTLRIWDVPRPSPVRLLEGHTAVVRDVAVSVDGKLAVTLSDDKTGRVWKLPEAIAAFTLSGLTESPTSAAIRGDGNLIGGGDRKGRIYAWDTLDGALTQAIWGHAGAISRLRFHPNNQQLITAGAEGWLKVWQLPFAAPRSIEGHTADVTAVAIGGDGSVVSASNEHVHVHRLQDGQAVRELANGPKTTSRLAISPNNAIVAAASEKGDVQLWTLSDGAERPRIEAHDHRIHGLAFHSDNGRIATAGADGSLRIWRLPAPPQLLAGHTAPVTRSAISPNGSLSATASNDKTVRLWSMMNGQQTRALSGHKEAVTALAFRRDSAQLASGDVSGSIHVWNPADGAPLGLLGAHEGPVRGLAYDGAGQRLATAGDDSLLKIWKLPSPPPLTLAGNTADVASVAISDDGKIVVTGGADKSVRLFDSASGQAVRALSEPPEAITSVAISQDDKLVAASAANGVVKIWNVASGEAWTGEGDPPANAEPAPSVLIGHDGAIRSVAFTSSNQIVTGGEDGSVRVWSLPRRALKIDDKSGPATVFVVSKDRKRAAIAGVFEGKPAIFVRDLTKPALPIIQRLLGHGAPITSIAFQENGKSLLTGDSAGKAHLWDLTDAKFPQRTTVSLSGAIAATAVSPDGAQLFLAIGNVIHQHQAKDASETRQLKGHTATISCMEIVGATLFSGGADSTVRRWNVTSGAAAAPLNQGSAVTRLAIRPDGAQLASAGADRKVKLWNAASGAAEGALEGPTTDIVSLTYDPAGQSLLSAGAGDVWHWDVAQTRRLQAIAMANVQILGTAFVEGDVICCGADGSLRRDHTQVVRVLDAHPGGVTAMAVSRDGKRCVTAGADKFVKCWNLTDGSLLATFAAGDGVQNAVAMTPDMKQVVGGGADGKLRTWIMPVAAMQAAIAADSETDIGSEILSLSLAADGDRLAIGLADNRVAIRSIENAWEIERFSTHAEPVRSVAIFGDGMRVVSGSSDKTARISTISASHVVRVETATKGLTDVVVAPNGMVVASGGEQAAAIYQLTATEFTAQGTLPADPAKTGGYTPDRQVALSLSLDGNLLSSLDATGRACIWKLDDQSLLCSIAASEPADASQAKPGEPPTIDDGELSLSADGSQVVIGRGNEVRVHHASDGRRLQQWIQTDSVTTVSLTPDTSRVLIGRSAATENASVVALDLERLIDAHSDTAHCVVFAADGNSAFSGGDKGDIVQWALADGKPAAAFQAGEAAVLDLAVTTNGKTLVAVGGDQKLRIWALSPQPAADADKKSIAPTRELALAAPVKRLDLSPDGLRVVIGREDGVVEVLDVTTGGQLQRFESDALSTSAVAFAADNKTIVSAGAKGAARIETLSLLRAIQVGNSPVADVDLANAGANAVTATAEGAAIWNLANGQLVRDLKTVEEAATPEGAAEPAPNETPDPPPIAIRGVAVRSDNTQVATIDSQGTLALWNPANGQRLAATKLDAELQQVAFSPDNNKIVVRTSDHQLNFFAPADLAPTYSLSSDKALDSVVFARDSRTLYSVGADVREWRYASPEAVRTMTGHGGPVLGVTFSPNGRWIASASADQTVRLWNPTTGAQVKQFTGHQGAAYSVTFSPDESLLVSCGAEKGLRVWDVLGGRQLKQINVGDGSLYSVTFLPDGKRIAAAGLERNIYLIDLLSGALQQTLQKHDDYVYRVAMNRAGTRLMSCGYGGKIALWNAANGQLVYESDLERVANFADFAPDGQRIVVASSDGRAYFVDLPANAR